MSNNIVDHETEQATRKILTYWFGSALASTWQITDRTVVATAELVDATSKCSGLFKFVPTPSGAFNGVGIVGTMAYHYAKDAVKRAVTDNSYYNSCIKDQAVRRRSVIEETTY